MDRGVTVPAVHLNTTHIDHQYRVPVVARLERYGTGAFSQVPEQPMTVSVLDIVTTPTDTVAVVTGIVPHPRGEPQVFLRDLHDNTPRQTTHQLIIHGPYHIIGNWTNDHVRARVTETYPVSINPYDAVKHESLPSYDS